MKTVTNEQINDRAIQSADLFELVGNWDEVEEDIIAFYYEAEIVPTYRLVAETIGKASEIITKRQGTDGLLSEALMSLR